MLLYLVIRGKLLFSYIRDVLERCIFNSGYKGHKGTCLFQRCWSLCKSLPRITRYSNSVLVWRIPTVVFLFNQFNSVYQIRSKVTCKRLIPPLPSLSTPLLPLCFTSPM